MQSPNFYRVGAGAAMLGAVVGVIFNILHPRDTDAFDSVEAELQMIADSGIWRWDHLMLGFAVAVGFIGLVAIGMSMFNGSGDTWARAAVIFGAVASAVALVNIALDGTAIKSLADQWAAGDEAITGAATALVEVNTALLGATIVLLFGITPWLLGAAFVASDAYPTNLGYAELVGAAVGGLTALLLAIGGLTALAIYLFVVASLVHTVVIFIAGWTLWKASATTTAGMTAA